VVIWKTAFPIMLLYEQLSKPNTVKKINKHYPAFRFCSIIKLRYLETIVNTFGITNIEVTDSSSKQENKKILI
jgi:hypothetical protein